MGVSGHVLKVNEIMKCCARLAGAWIFLLAWSSACHAFEFDVTGPWGVTLTNGKVYFELGEENLDADILVWRKTGDRASSYQLLRWGKSQDEILMWVSGPGRQSEGVDWWHHSFVARAFHAVRGENGKYVVDVTRLFTGDESAWALSFDDGTGAYPSLPNIEVHEVSAYPENLVVRAVQSSQDRQLENAWNFVVLPETPMETRLFDPRVGYMYPGHQFFWGEPAPEANEVILRWRLEQSSLDEESREPKTPIVIHIDPDTPEKWKKWVRSGVHAWDGPFESAGIDSALKLVDGSKVLDWSYDDLRRSVLCWEWEPSVGCGSWQGIFDPRTGEILQFQIPVSGAFEHFLAKYVVTMTSVDSRILAGAFEDVAGALLQYVVSHEMGHFLGLRDGMYGTGVYTERNVRSADWVRVNGFSPSVMNYSRFNYVAQPEDEMPVELLVQGVGPADHYSIRLGYAVPSPGGAGHDRSVFPKSQLQLQNRDPTLRYRRASHQGTDPGNVMDVVSISDPVRASVLGVKNLQRSVELLAHHGLGSPDLDIRPFLEKKQLYEAAVAQWIDMSKHPLSLIGSYVPKQGLNANMRVSDFKQLQDAGSVLPVEEGVQHDAMVYLCRNVFADGPEFLIQSDFSRESGFNGSEMEKKIRDGKDEIFGLLSRPERWRRLVDQGEKMHRALPGSLTSPREWAVVNVIRGLKSCLVDQEESY